MPGIDEDKNIWRFRIRDPADFEKFRVKELGHGVKITVGRIKNSQRWEIQNYIFEKERFKTKEQVRKWLDEHLKAEIKTLLDFKAWNDWRRRFVNAYVQISEVT
jgi:hypothetical protein